MEIYSHIYPSTAASTVPAFTQGTSRSERGAAPTTSAPPDRTTTTQVGVQEEAAGPEEERSAEGKDWKEASDRLPAAAAASASSEEEPGEGRGLTDPPPNVVEPPSDHRGNRE